MTARDGGSRPNVVRRGRCVLLVEDTDPVRQLVEEALKADGFAVREARSFDAALDELPFADIVLTDLELGGRSGVELIGVIASRFPELPVVAMSGNPALLKEATHAGAIAVLAKPFDLGQLRVVTTLAEVAAAASGHERLL